MKSYRIRLRTGGIAFAIEFAIWGFLSMLTFGLFAPVFAWRCFVRFAEAIEVVEENGRLD